MNDFEQDLWKQIVMQRISYEGGRDATKIANSVIEALRAQQGGARDEFATPPPPDGDYNQVHIRRVVSYEVARRFQEGRLGGAEFFGRFNDLRTAHDVAEAIAAHRGAELVRGVPGVYE